MCAMLCGNVIYIRSALSIICFTCSNILLYTNMISHSQYVFVFGLNAILFQVNQHMMSFMLEMERFCLYQRNALINVTSGHRILFHIL